MRIRIRFIPVQLATPNFVNGPLRKIRYQLCLTAAHQISRYRPITIAFSLPLLAVLGWVTRALVHFNLKSTKRHKRSVPCGAMHPLPKCQAGKCPDPMRHVRKQQQNIWGRVCSPIVPILSDCFKWLRSF